MLKVARTVPGAPNTYCGSQLVKSCCPVPSTDCQGESKGTLAHRGEAIVFGDAAATQAWLCLERVGGAAVPAVGDSIAIRICARRDRQGGRTGVHLR